MEHSISNAMLLMFLSPFSFLCFCSSVAISMHFEEFIFGMEWFLQFSIKWLYAVHILSKVCKLRNVSTSASCEREKKSFFMRIWSWMRLCISMYMIIGKTLVYKFDSFHQSHTVMKEWMNWTRNSSYSEFGELAQLFGSIEFNRILDQVMESHNGFPFDILLSNFQHRRILDNFWYFDLRRLKSVHFYNFPSSDFSCCLSIMWSKRSK